MKQDCICLSGRFYDLVDGRSILDGIPEQYVIIKKEPLEVYREDLHTFFYRRRPQVLSPCKECERLVAKLYSGNNGNGNGCS